MSDYEQNKTDIFKALVLGISCNELPDWEREGRHCERR